MKTIVSQRDGEPLAEAAKEFSAAKKVAALTGAGISVGSGIPDFRSPGGVWAIYAPEEYATIEAFRQDPQKAWKLYRELGKGLVDKKPNPAHEVLADLERQGLLHGIITQNIDNLHQSAGNTRVFEFHGDHQHLQCIQCGHLEPVREVHYSSHQVPTCRSCDFPLKPNIVLFGEAVRNLEEVNAFISECDLLLVIGTSAQVYPAAGLPAIVKRNGGILFEFNRQPALGHGLSDYFFAGDLGVTLPMFGRAVLARN